ncbi:type IV toxin-antitoxin system AbiEi family antitoxin domain-containing protein [Candidatus Bathyarchaeota archaeon]|nr:type IV toxin-antitoxin system AbiEi family antitoxin domain-containing protein [Candidatus Bathyarchaeota archaeon]
MSLRDRLEEIAEAAGITVDQLLKAAGVLRILEILAVHGDFSGEKRGSRLKKKVLYKIQTETVVSVREVIGEFGEEALKVLGELEEEGKVVTVENDKIGALTAICDDGSLNIKRLDREEMESLVVDYYMNRDKALSYRQVLEIRREIKRETAKNASSKREKMILEALREGAKTRRELEAMCGGHGSASWTLSHLLKKGRIVRVGKGVYALAKTG